MEKFSLLRAHANDDETKPTKIVQNRKLYISGKVFTHAPMMNGTETFENDERDRNNQTELKVNKNLFVLTIYTRKIKFSTTGPTTDCRSFVTKLSNRNA